MSICTPAPLTPDEVAALRAVQSGQQPAGDSHTASLIDKGYLTRDGDALKLTPHGDDHINFLPNYGEALVDILIPGAGTAAAAKRDIPGDDTAPAPHQTKP